MYKHNRYFYVDEDFLKRIEKDESLREKIPQYKIDHMRPIKWYQKDYSTIGRNGKAFKKIHIFKN